jgi:hypothetical protein
MKLTPWYPIGTNPVRTGVYQVRNGGMTYYRWYSSATKKWALGGGSTPDNAVDAHRRDGLSLETNIIDDAWRGVFRKPDVPAKVTLDHFADTGKKVGGAA